MDAATGDLPPTTQEIRATNRQVVPPMGHDVAVRPA